MSDFNASSSPLFFVLSACRARISDYTIFVPGAPWGPDSLASGRAYLGLIVLSADFSLGPRASDFGFRVSGCGSWISDFGFRASDCEPRASGFGSRATGCGPRASGFSLVLRTDLGLASFPADSSFGWMAGMVLPGSWRRFWIVYKIFTTNFRFFCAVWNFRLKNGKILNAVTKVWAYKSWNIIIFVYMLINFAEYYIFNFISIFNSYLTTIFIPFF